MKNPHQLSNTWNRSMNKDPILVSVPGTNKKFKRKSREPKRLYSPPETERMKTYQADMSDADSAEDTPAEACNVSRLAPVQRQQMTSQESTASSAGMLPGLPKCDTAVAPAHSGAIDMRIGINVPTITSKLLNQMPTSPFSNREISHWPAVISQPLTNRLKLGIRSSFSMSTSTSSSSHSPSHQAFSMEPHTSQCHEYLEPQLQSPEGSPRKRTDGPRRHPEVKAVQQTRRLLANARERTRVHTISAAFEALRKQVPCYSYGQKLSKLAILRIACNYILSLAQLADLDYSPDDGSVNFSQCVEQCTRTLQAEGRSKKRKE